MLCAVFCALWLNTKGRSTVTPVLFRPDLRCGRTPMNQSARVMACEAETERAGERDRREGRGARPYRAYESQRTTMGGILILTRGIDSRAAAPPTLASLLYSTILHNVPQTPNALPRQGSNMFSGAGRHGGSVVITKAGRGQGSHWRSIT